MGLRGFATYTFTTQYPVLSHDPMMRRSLAVSTSAPVWRIAGRCVNKRMRVFVSACNPIPPGKIQGPAHAPAMHDHDQ